MTCPITCGFGKTGGGGRCFSSWGFRGEGSPRRRLPSPGTGGTAIEDEAGAQMSRDSLGGDRMKGEAGLSLRVGPHPGDTSSGSCGHFLCLRELGVSPLSQPLLNSWELKAVGVG